MLRRAGGNHLSVRPEPGTCNAASNNSFPIWSCCGRGLPVRWGSRLPPGGLLPRLFTLTGINSGGFFSVALSFLRLIVRSILLSRNSVNCYAEKDFPLCAVRTFLPRYDPGAIACQPLPFNKYTTFEAIFKSSLMFFSFFVVFCISLPIAQWQYRSKWL